MQLHLQADEEALKLQGSRKTQFLQSDICSIPFVFHKCQYTLYELNIFPSPQLLCFGNEISLSPEKMGANYQPLII